MRFGKLLRNLAFAAVAATMVAVSPAHAQSALDRILSAKKIVIAVQNDVPPYSLINKDNQLDGFDIDVAKAIAKDLGVELELQVVTGANRIPALVSGRADMVIATLGINPQRAAAVAMSIPYTAFPQVLISTKDKTIHNFDDLRGKVVGLTRGTMQEEVISRAATGATIRRFQDDATTIQALLSGQIDATAFGATVANDIAARNPSRGIEIKFNAFNVYASIGMRRGDTDLIRWVNTWIFYQKNSGLLADLHKKWLHIDMPDLPAF
jgi:polar amino acid transport system substrate-binding protein